MAVAFIYNEEWWRFSYGELHPMKPLRLKLTYDIIKAVGLLEDPEIETIEGKPASIDYILRFHTRDYIDELKYVDSGAPSVDSMGFGLGSGDNPVFPGVFRWSMLVTGASIQAAELVSSKAFTAAFNISGGLHHAMNSRASGFCYINDPVIAIYMLIESGYRVAYIDIDAHHGDGVQYAFYERDDVLTISIHESGDYLFPGTGQIEEKGRENGEGYSINLPLPPDTDDTVYIRAFKELVPPLIENFKPDIIIAQLGADTLWTDPLTHLKLSLYGFEEVVRMIKGLSRPLVALGGGGYDVEGVAKAWTLALSVISGVKLPEEIPQNIAGSLGLKNRNLRGEKFENPEYKQKRLWDEVATRIDRLLTIYFNRV